MNRMPLLRLSLCAAIASATLPAQAPEQKEIPVPPIRTSLPALPAVSALPVRAEMPEVMVMNDGARVTTEKQWRKRRVEIRRILEYYAVGRIPPAPRNVKGLVEKTESVLDGKAVYRLVRLTFGPNSSLTLHAGLLVPAGKGPHPAVVMMGSTPPGAPELKRLPPGPNQGRGQNVLTVVGPGPDSKSAPAPAMFRGPATAEASAQRHAAVVERGYAVAMFNPNDCAEDTTLRNMDGSWAFRNTRFYPAYPGYDWGILGGWAWGASRVADYLETDRSIDKKKLIVTGASRNGKASMIAAAFDSRFMGAPVVTGGGGMGAYRFAGPRGSETLDVMLMKYPNWFSPHLLQFRGQKERLPFDQHWFVALCAPQPFITLEGITDTISLPEAVKQTLAGAQPAYDLLGAKDSLGVNFAAHGHAFTAEDWTAMLDFADWHWRGQRPAKRFDAYPTEAELDAALAKARAAASKKK
jgi:hypothetical protein